MKYTVRAIPLITRLGKYMNLEKKLSKYKNKFILKRKSEDTKQFVYRILSTLILNMILTPGQRLNEQKLASFMDVSRTPLHDTFTKLSKNNLVDIIPMKGSFVSKVDKKRIYNAVWLNVQVCISMIHGIFITDVKKSELNILNEILIQLEYNYTHGDFLRASRSLVQFYHHLFILGGNFEILWSKLYEYESDLFRLYSLALRDSKFSYNIHKILLSITNALIKRDNDLACQLFSQHMASMLDIVDLLIDDNLNVLESFTSA